MLLYYHFSMLGMLLVNCVIDESLFRYEIHLDFTMLSLSVLMSIIVGLLYIPTNKLLPLRVFLPLLFAIPLSYMYYHYIGYSSQEIMVPILTIILAVYYMIFCFFWIYNRNNPNNNEMFYSATVSLTVLSFGIICVVIFFLLLIFFY